MKQIKKEIAEMRNKWKKFRIQINWPLYNKALTDILDKHAPKITFKITMKHCCM